MADRRSFFRWLASEAVATAEQMQGIPQLRLADLPQLPDEALARIIPAVRSDVVIAIAGADVTAQVPGRQEPLVLFPTQPADSMELFAFNRFNGRGTLAAIADELAAATSQKPAESFAKVREFFLRMAGRGVCVPVNA